MKLNKEVIFQFLKFGIVGVINTTIHTVVFNVCMQIGFNYLVSQTLGFLISSIGGFIMNYKMVFKSDSKNKSIIIKYYLVYGSSYILTMALSYLYVDIMKLNLNVVLGSFSLNILPLLTLPITVPYNFILNKFWVYK